MASSRDEVLDAVAVVGLAGRFPGAGSVDELWENLKAGRESIHVFSDEELADEGIPEELIRDPSYVKARGLIEQPEAFDAAFFGISPREAELMDPQHRLFLETCWHALENAGYPPASVDGRVGVWGGMSTGMSNDTYLHSNLGGPRGVPEVDVLPAMLGNENDYLTTRVSYKLDLRGPSVNVQTACSTSLVAVVQGFQSLMTWGCDVALAGGVSVSYPQKGGYLHQEGGIGSPDGHCRPFDADAQGTVFSNGVGVVVLKRLEDALEDGDRVLAVVRGAASNNDGAAKVSFAAPSVAGQAEVIASALAVADVEPSSVTFVETHGTGTPIGDPIEVEGLTKAFRRGTDDTGFCALGSIKSNFGHLDSAAGVAGFIKAVLSLHHRTLVPTVHFATPSPRIDWEASPFYVNAETRPWDTDRLPRRAGVSAFGIGGTNAHVVLEEAPPRRETPGDTGPQLVPLSARSVEAREAAARRLAAHLEAHPDLSLRDVATTLQVGREAFRHRAALVASGIAEARDVLASGDPTRLVTGDAEDGIDGYVFLFPGGGAQYVGMARDLYRSQPGFRAEVDRGIELLEEREGIDLRSIWFADGDTAATEERFQRPSLQLPALFILEMALARQLMRWGFEPTALIGHSMGENTAACLSGVLSYEDALGLVALRGRLFDTAAAGGMLSVTADAETVRSRMGADLDLAAVNGPEQCTVSGPRDAIDALAAGLDAEGIDARVVPIDIAAHSSLVEPLLEPFEAYLRGVELHPPRIPFLSNRTGTWITDAQATDPAYWAGHLRDTVRFADDVRTVLDAGSHFFLEVGPGRILSSLVKLCAPAVGSRVAATMRHPRETIADEAALLTAVARAWVAGAEVDWDRIRGDAPLRRVPLPGYPFERRPYLVQPGRAEPTGRGTPAATGTARGSGKGRDDVMARLLELQTRTNAAIEALLGGRRPETPHTPSETRDEAEASSSAESSEDRVAPESLFPPAVADGDAPVPELAAQRDFWRERLEAPLPVLDLMTDAVRTPERVRQRAVVERDAVPELLGALAGMARAEGVDPMAVLLTGAVAVLNRSTGQDELVIGIPVKPRTHVPPGPDLGSNTAPLRIRIEPQAPFRALLHEVGNRLGEARLNGDVPFDDLVDQPGVPDDPARGPVTQFRFGWGDMVTRRSADRPPPDLDLRIAPADDGLRLTVEYSGGLYASETIDDLLRHLEELLIEAATDPGVHLAALPGAASRVLERMEGWQGPDEPMPETDLASWLAEAWGDVAGDVAVVAGAHRTTYAELETRSNRLAHHLVAVGVRPGDLVGICLDRHADLVVAAVAVWKAGAGYVPLDPTHPPARLGLIARRADVRVLITEEAFADGVDADVPHRILVDRDGDVIATCAGTRPRLTLDLSAPAYVLFTSGSTGEPKGVRVPARAVVNFLRTMARRPGFHRSDVMLNAATLAFDISVLEIFLPLRMGGTVAMASVTEAKDGAALARLIDTHEVTVVQFTPSSWRLLMLAGWEGRPVRAISGGEALPRDLLRWMLPRVSEVWNGYGPTETTVYMTFARLTDADAPIHVGPPFPNTRCYVLDPSGRRLPPGVAGELHIGGVQVAEGYVARPEETARQFVPDPFSSDGSRMYASGDVMRWRRDGTLEHLRRVDHQVKLRGFRIELGEVEAALAAGDDVQAAVALLTEVDGSSELVGYVVAPERGWNDRKLRDRLAERLPPYMIPRFLVRLDALPLTARGKTDRTALPDPRAAATPAHASGFALPETEAETYLVEVWQEVLAVPEVSVDDNFFDLGGHSLLAVRAMARIREDRGAEVPLRALITGTLRLIAKEYLSGEGASPGPENEEGPGAVSRVLGTMREWISR